MSLGQALLLGFEVATTPFNLLLALAGAFLGTLVGMLPGLGVSATLAILLPVTFGMDPASSLILMAGVYCGARYGGSTTAILMNLPGESSSVVTAIDGYQLALQGRAGPALGLAAISSFIAGTASVLGLMLFAPVLSRVAISLHPAEYFALAILGLAFVTSLSGKSVVKGLIASTFGVLIAQVGADPMTSVPRLTFGRLEFLDGINFVTVAVGLFAISEVIVNLEKQVKFTLIPIPRGLRNLLPTLDDLRKCVVTWIESFSIGFFIGVLPGAGATAASFVSYTVAKATSPRAHTFGKGAVEGVAASESADNASTGGNLVPMFTLGIPGSSGTAMMMAVLVIAGATPGPFFIEQHPDIFWGMVASMYIGNVMLLVLNLPLIPIIINLLRIPYYVLYIGILIISSIGVYNVENNVFDLFVMLVFGVIGYACRKLDYPAAAILLAMILSPLAEKSLRQSLILSRGSIIDIFLNRPASAAMVLFAILILAAPALRRLFSRRRNRAVPSADGASGLVR
jgi:putative tricarboxylic transport membrane protein